MSETNMYMNTIFRPSFAFINSTPWSGKKTENKTRDTMQLHTEYSPLRDRIGSIENGEVETIQQCIK